MHPWHAVVLGLVEGLTEFLPISSTGHLILTAHLLGLHGEAVKTFEVVIQSGAVAAVLGLYAPQVAAMARGAAGRDAEGRRLLRRLLLSFLPAAVVGLTLSRVIKAWLFGVWPVIVALAVGGVLMVLVEAWRRPPLRADRTLASITAREALLIGLAQCLSLWPGLSRSMATIVAGILVGLPAPVAAEYSFLLALPTLGAATALDLLRGGAALLAGVGLVPIGLGFAVAGLIAAVTIRGFVRYLTRWGLAPFGWYRLLLAACVWAATSV